MSESEADDVYGTESDHSDRGLDIGHIRGNQFIRKTVVALNRGANDLINHSTVAKYTLSSVGRLVEPVVKLADPIVSSIDDRIDSIVDAIRQVTVLDDPIRNPRAFWDSLKRTFVSSAWFSNVESILSASAAEYFYVTALACYFDLDPAASCDEFLAALRLRLGDTWDDRLTQPARVFYATSRTATAVIGLGKFVRGAIGLGRSKIHSAIGQIAETWDRVVGVTDNVVDRWRPEFSRRPASDYGVNREEDTAESGTGGDGPVAAVLLDDVKLLQGDSVINGKRRGMSTNAPRISRRVRQRLPLSVPLREKLSEDLWFDRIDMILDKNIVIRSLSSMSQPADHFFDTASRVYLSVSDIEEFVQTLRNTLGPAWDPDLEDPSQRFYEIASSL